MIGVVAGLVALGLVAWIVLPMALPALNRNAKVRRFNNLDR